MHAFPESEKADDALMRWFFPFLQNVVSVELTIEYSIYFELSGGRGLGTKVREI